MRADNTRHLAKAAHRRAEQTRRRAVTALRQLADTNEPLTVSTLAQRANVSRAWLYTQPDLLNNPRERPNPPNNGRPARSATDASLHNGYSAHHASASRERQPAARHALAQALGDQRARHARNPHQNPS